MTKTLDTKFSKGNELTDLIWIFGGMNNIDLIEEFCAYKTEEDKSGKDYEFLENKIETMNKDWIKDLAKTKKSDFLFYRTLNRRGIEPVGGKLSSLRGAIMSVYGYSGLKAGTMEVELIDGSKKKKGYSERLDHCKPSRIREFAKKSYFNGEKIYDKILSEY